MKRLNIFILIALLLSCYVKVFAYDVTSRTISYPYSSEINKSELHFPGDVSAFAGYFVCGMEANVRWSGVYYADIKYSLLPLEQSKSVKFVCSDDEYEVGDMIGGCEIISKTKYMDFAYAPDASIGGYQGEIYYAFTPDENASEGYIITEIKSDPIHVYWETGKTFEELKPENAYKYLYCVEKEPLLEGSCGANVRYKLIEGGMMVIDGSGDMNDYASEENVPWHSVRESIQSVTMSEGITSIASYAFWGCDGISEITIPASVVKIGDKAFYGCSKLSIVTNLSKNPQAINKNVFEGTSSSKILYVPENSLNLYENNSSWNIFTEIIPMEEDDDATAVSKKVEIKIGGAYSIIQWGGTVIKTMSATITNYSNKTVHLIELKAEHNGSNVLSNVNSSLKDLEPGESLYIEYRINRDVTPTFKLLCSIDETTFTVSSDDVVICLNVNVNNGGVVFVNDKKITNSPRSLFYTEGEDVKINITPSEHYYVKRMLIDNEDVTSAIVEGMYVIEGINASHKVEVEFAEALFTITFDTDGGTYIDSVTGYAGAEVNESNISTPTKEGYTFIGWNKEIPKVIPMGDITITALWEINKYTITFDTDGGTAIDEMTFDYGADIKDKIPTNTTKTGYTFQGWDQVLPETMPAKDIHLIALWKVNSYKLTFVTDGETVEEKIFNFGDAVTVTDIVPQKEGYTFSGWSEIPETMPAHDVVVNGSFTINKYIIQFVNEDGTVLQNSEVEYGAVPVYSGATPTKSSTVEYSYTFAGWTPEIVAVTATATYTATYTSVPNQYKLTYKVDGATYKEYTLNYGDVIIPEAEPTKEGYTFSGWNDVPSVMPANDVIVTASFTKNKYKGFISIDDETIDIGEFEYGESIVLPEIESREGYTWVWDAENPTVVPASDFTLNGSYVVNKYKIRYILNGEVVGEFELEYGSQIPEFNYTPSTPNITIHGWYSDYAYTTMPAKDIEYVADFTDGIFTPLYDKKVDVYTTNGKKIKTGILYSKAMKELPNGVYIINGKTTFINNR